MLDLEALDDIDEWEGRLGATPLPRPGAEEHARRGAPAPARDDEEEDFDLLDYAADLLSYRAEVMAEAESGLGAAEGQRIAWGRMVEDGIVPETTSKMWVARETSCDVCAELDGQVVPLDELFESEEGEYNGPPEPHPHCRCSVVIVEEGEENRAPYPGELLVAERHGDEPGHPFRGNQWTDGGGGEKTLGESQPYAKLRGLTVPKLARGEVYLVRHSDTNETDSDELGTYAHAARSIDKALDASSYYQKGGLAVDAEGKVTDTGDSGFVFIGVDRWSDDWEQPGRSETRGVKEVRKALTKANLVMAVDASTGKVVWRRGEKHGDTPGHPFRGNQWTEGAGDDADPELNFPGDDDVRDAEYNDGLDEQIQDEHEEFLQAEDSHELRRAISEYVQDQSDVNGVLRSKPREMERRMREDRAEDYSGEVRKAMVLQEAIENAPPVDPPLIVYRGAHLSENTLAKVVEGKNLKLAGFQSTSVDPATATGFGGHLLEIRAKKGLFINSAEKELLLPHGSRFRVIGQKELRVMADRGRMGKAREERMRVIQLEQIDD